MASGKKMLRCFAFVLCAFILCSCQNELPPPENANEINPDDVERKKIENDIILSADGTVLEKVLLTFPQKELYVPDGVTTIASDAICYTKIEKIIMPASVKRVEDQAVMFNDNLTEVEMQSVESIGRQAFYHNLSLHSVSADCAAGIGAYTFAGCTSLAFVEMNSLREVGEGAFLGCESLTSVSFPAVERIGDYAFLNCRNLMILNVPNVSEINAKALNGTGLKWLVAPLLDIDSSDVLTNAENIEVFTSLEMCLKHENEKSRVEYLVYDGTFGSKKYSIKSALRWVLGKVTFFDENGSVVLHCHFDDVTPLRQIAENKSGTWSIVYYDGMFYYVNNRSVNWMEGDEGITTFLNVRGGVIQNSNGVIIYGDFSLIENDDGMTVTGYHNDYVPDVIVPEYVLGKPVTELGCDFLPGAMSSFVQSVTAKSVTRLQIKYDEDDNAKYADFIYLHLKKMVFPKLGEIPEKWNYQIRNADEYDFSTALKNESNTEQ